MELASLDDQQLMLKFGEGHDQAFDLLFKRFEKRILNYVYRFFRRKSIAEEMTQEVFLRVYKARGKYRPEAQFSSWIYKIATNVCLKQLKRKEYLYRNQAIEDVEYGLGDEKPGADKMIEEEQQAARVRTCVAQLAPKRQAVLILRNYDDMSHKEIAEVMGTSESAVKSLLHRAYRDLEKAIRKKEKE